MRLAGTGFFAAFALSIACAPADAPKTASDTALRVFELASEIDPDPAALDALFAAFAAEDRGGDVSADRRADLYDVLERLGQASDVRVTASHPLEGLDITAVDLAGDLPGGGRAEYSVHLERVEGDSWRVTWLVGPGVDWPKRRRGRGTGLSTSNPPAGSDTR